MSCRDFSNNPLTPTEMCADRDDKRDYWETIIPCRCTLRAVGQALARQSS